MTFEEIAYLQYFTDKKHLLILVAMTQLCKELYIDATSVCG